MPGLASDFPLSASSYSRRLLARLRQMQIVCRSHRGPPQGRELLFPRLARLLSSSRLTNTYRAAFPFTSWASVVLRVQSIDHTLEKLWGDNLVDSPTCEWIRVIVVILPLRIQRRLKGKQFKRHHDEQQAKFKYWYCSCREISQDVLDAYTLPQISHEI